MVGAPVSAGVAGAAKSWPFLLDTETLLASSTSWTKYCSTVDSVTGALPVNVTVPPTTVLLVRDTEVQDFGPVSLRARKRTVAVLASVLGEVTAKLTVL